MDNDEQAFLADYDPARFERPSFTVDLVIFTVRDESLQVLLVRRDEHPARGCWALPGGFVDIHRDATIDDCAQRKLLEKTGVAAPYLEQLATYGSRDRDPRYWTATTVYFALLAASALAPEQDPALVRWWSVQGCGVATPLAFDHGRILADAVLRLRNKLEYTHIAVHLLPETFTLPELQRTYELILQQPLDKSSFRRRVTEAALLEALPGQFRDSPGRRRPAQLYRFRHYDRQTFFPRSLARYAR